MAAIIGRPHARKAPVREQPHQLRGITLTWVNFHRDPLHPVEPAAFAFKKGEFRAFDIDLQQVHTFEAVRVQDVTERDNWRNNLASQAESSLAMHASFDDGRDVARPGPPVEHPLVAVAAGDAHGCERRAIGPQLRDDVGVCRGPGIER